MKSDTDHEIRQLMRYLERTSMLRQKVAHALAYSMHGFSTSGIAGRLDTSQPTAERWLQEVEAIYGPDPLLIHDPGKPELELLTPGDVIDESGELKEWWVERAERCENQLPDELASLIDDDDGDDDGE